MWGIDEYNIDNVREIDVNEIPCDNLYFNPAYVNELFKEKDVMYKCVKIGENAIKGLTCPNITEETTNPYYIVTDENIVGLYACRGVHIGSLYYDQKFNKKNLHYIRRCHNYMYSIHEVIKKPLEDILNILSNVNISTSIILYAFRDFFLYVTHLTKAMREKLYEICDEIDVDSNNLPTQNTLYQSISVLIVARKFQHIKSKDIIVDLIRKTITKAIDNNIYNIIVSKHIDFVTYMYPPYQKN